MEWFRLPCMHSWHTHIAPAFAVLRFWRNPDFKKQFFFPHARRLQFFSTVSTDHSIAYMQVILRNWKSLSGRKLQILNEKVLRKKILLQMCFSSSLKIIHLLFSIINPLLLGPPFHKMQHLLFMLAYNMQEVYFVCKASPYIMQLLWLLTYLNSGIWSGLHSFIWMDFHGMDLNDPPVATFSVFAFLA